MGKKGSASQKISLNKQELTRLIFKSLKKALIKKNSLSTRHKCFHGQEYLKNRKKLFFINQKISLY